MSPNLNRGPGSGPTEDEFENTRIIGQRQADAAAALATDAGDAVDGGVDARMTYVDLGRHHGQAGVHRRRPRHTAPRRTWRWRGRDRGHRRGQGVPGLQAGPQPVRRRDLAAGRLPVLVAAARLAVRPKAIVLPGGALNRLAPFVQERVPVQLLRIGRLYLIGIPGEVTITAGLRMRREVAAVVGAELDDVLVAGYSNAYIHYVTTPEEYDEQRYEGGSTLFGRWEAPALTQIAVRARDRDARGEPRRSRDAAAGPLAGPEVGARSRAPMDAAVGPAVRRRAVGATRSATGGASRSGSRSPAPTPTTTCAGGGTFLEVEQRAWTARGAGRRRRRLGDEAALAQGRTAARGSRSPGTSRPDASAGGLPDPLSRRRRRLPRAG